MKVALSFLHVMNAGTPKGRSVRPPPQMTLHGRSMKINSETSKKMSSPRMMRRTYSGDVSYYELS